MSALAVVAGLVSTIFFVGAALPMVLKAVATRDLESYSLGNLLLANSGNAVHSLYVFTLPAGSSAHLIGGPHVHSRPRRGPRR